MLHSPLIIINTPASSSSSSLQALQANTCWFAYKECAHDVMSSWNEKNQHGNPEEDGRQRAIAYICWYMYLCSGASSIAHHTQSLMTLSRIVSSSCATTVDVLVRNIHTTHEYVYGGGCHPRAQQKDATSDQDEDAASHRISHQMRIGEKAFCMADCWAI